jgi:uncharacterized membrane protein HdeD (DUF308 family)
MTTKATASSSNGWIWTIVRGVIALALGLFLIAGGDTARTAVAYALAAYIAITGAMQTFSGLLNRQAPGSVTDRIRGLVGLIGGVAMILLLYFNVLQLGTAYTFIAILAIAYGLLGIFESFFDRGQAYFRWMPVIVNVMLILLGVLVFYSRTAAGFDLQLWSGVVFAILGTAVVVYGYFVQKPSPQVLATNI